MPRLKTLPLAEWSERLLNTIGLVDDGTAAVRVRRRKAISMLRDDPLDRVMVTKLRALIMEAQRKPRARRHADR
jgi:hypothetical protein